MSGGGRGGRRRRRNVYWGGPWIGGGGFGAAVGRRRRRLRRFRRRRRIQRRRRRREILMHDSVDRVVTPFLSRRTPRSAPGTAPSCTARRRGATTCRAAPTSISCWSSTISLPGRSRRWPARSAPGGRRARAAAAHQPGRMGPRHRRLPHRDHRHARGYKVLRGADPVAGLRVEPGRPASRAGARVARQAAAAAAGVRRRVGRSRGARRRWRCAAPARCWCCSAGCSSCSARRCPRDPLELCRGGRGGRGHRRRAAARRGAPPGGARLALPADEFRATWMPWRARRLSRSTSARRSAMKRSSAVPRPSSRSCCSRADAATTRFRRWTRQVNQAQGQIQTQLQRRADLIPNLVETVKGVAKQEDTVFICIANPGPGSPARCSRATSARWRRPTPR